MTLSEFKAWFDGFTESIPAKDGFNPEQAKRIRARVKEITDTPITWPIYVDRWVQPYRRYYESYGPVWVSDSAGDVPPNTWLMNNTSDAANPMLLAGRAEAASLVTG